MKSVQIDQLAEDFSRVLVVETPVPEPGPGQVRVRMQLSPVNPSDLNFIRGDYLRALERLIWNRSQDVLCDDPARKRPSPKPPYALGGEGVGILDACGPGVPEAALAGKRVAVIAGPPMGAWQEYTIVAAQAVLPVPGSISDELAAMFVINPLSAYAMVHEVLAVRPDKWLLQSAAGSALAKMVVRMSRISGFRTINLIRSEAHRPALAALGADVVINTETHDLRDEVARVTDGRGVDYAMDCVGGDVAGQMLQCLTLGGHMVVFGTLANTPIALPSRDMMMPATRLSGFFAGSWLALQPPASVPGVLGQVGQLAAKGVFDTPVNAVYPLTQVHEALAASQQRGRLGKVLLRIGS
jgi:NADPH:quinone reductase-like Zn-dependent oxidoreductase